jgi:hypothetical protein
MNRRRMDNGERDSWEREQRARQNPTSYEVRHYGHRRAFAAWWTCPTCREQVAPYVGHGHLTR